MKDLTKGNTFLVLLKFSIPLIIAGVIAQSYNLIDLAIAGKVIGSDALSATGSTSTLIQFLSSLFWGFGVAVSAVVGKLYGAKEYKRINTTIKTITIFVFIVMAFVCAFCMISSGMIMDLLKVDNEVKDSARSYFTIFMVALFIQSLTYIFTCILQSLGDSKYPMFMTLVSGVMNIGLNLLFVMVFKLGVNGLALATIIACLFSFIMGLFRIINVIKSMDGNLSFEFSFDELKNVSYLAIPCILQQCSLYLSSVIVQPLVNDLGKKVTAGYSIAMSYNTLVNSFYHAISRAIASYSSQSKGKKEYDNYSKGVYIGFGLQLIVVIPVLIFTIIFPNQIFMLFMKNNDTSCLIYSTKYVIFCIPFVCFCAFNNLMHSFYKSVGSVKTVLFTTTLFTISRICFSYLLTYGEVIDHVYLGLSLSWVIECISLMSIFYLGIWKNPEHKQYEKMKKLNNQTKNV